MESQQKNNDVNAIASNVMGKNDNGENRNRLILWMFALIAGAVLGAMGSHALNEFFSFVATVFTRLFQFIAVPTIALT